MDVSLATNSSCSNRNGRVKENQNQGSACSAWDGVLNDAEHGETVWDDCGLVVAIDETEEYGTLVPGSVIPYLNRDYES